MFDDLYHQFAPPEVTARRHILDAKLSDYQIITISICGELADIDSQNALFSFAQKNYRYLFSNFATEAVLTGKKCSFPDNGSVESENDFFFSYIV